MEGDYGHLLEEELHRAEAAVAVRGTITSFEMPWPVITEQFLSNVGRDPVEYLPHPPEVLSRMVFLHLRVAHAKEIAEWLPCTRVRPAVVLLLLQHLVRAKHPLMDSVAEADLMQRLQARVEELYPEQESHLPLEARSGTTPAVILERARCQNTEYAQTELLEKNATPAAASTTVGSADGAKAWSGSLLTSGTRADIAGVDRTCGARAEEETRETHGLGRYEHVIVETKSGFVDQWQPRFLSHAFPFSLPRAVSGPDFPQKSRDRRLASAAVVTPEAFTASLPARVEGSIRNDWNLVPAVRRITSFWQVACKSAVHLSMPKQKHMSFAAHAKAAVDAARSLYKRLTRGKWFDGKKVRPVQGDTSKLSMCHNLSFSERHLLKNMRLRSQSMSGTVIGQSLLGARIEPGVPLFITILPSPRHSGLVMRLSRYRQEDPAVAEERRPWIGAHEPSLWNPEVEERSLCHRTTLASDVRVQLGRVSLVAQSQSHHLGRACPLSSCFQNLLANSFPKPC